MIGQRHGQWFTEQREGGPAALQPWEYPGWFATAVDWIEATLPQTERVDQYATWSVSSLLRIETAAGRYYFKAAPPIFGHEAAVTEVLAKRFPDAIPRPIAIDGERGWMLTADFGDQLVATMEAPYWEGRSTRSPASNGGAWRPSSFCSSPDARTADPGCCRAKWRNSPLRAPIGSRTR